MLPTTTTWAPNLEVRLNQTQFCLVLMNETFTISTPTGEGFYFRRREEAQCETASHELTLVVCHKTLG